MQPIMPPVTTPDNLFHDGDPTQGIEGTIVTAEHLNNEQGAIRDVQQELINVLALAAMEPDPSKQDQLAEAISAIIGGSLPATFVTSVNTQTGAVMLDAGDVGAAPANHSHPGTLPNPIVLAAEDLNTLVTPNVYRQESDTNATLELNYPEAKSGSLIVTGGAGAQQRYHVYNTSRIYTRAQYDVNAFTPWAREYNTLNPPSLAELGGLPAVGAVLLFDDAAINPAAIYAGTTWARVAGQRNIRGCDDGEVSGQMGGSDTVALGIEHMPYHAHTVGNHTHHVPGHAHYLFTDAYSTYGAPSNAYPSGAVAYAGINRSTTDRDDYLLLASVGGNWTGVSNVGGETDTWGSTPATDAQGANAAFTVVSAFYKLHIWKRIS